mgnify:CR=1 FL=1
MYFLDADHYRLTCEDLRHSFLGGLSGLPYGMRHADLAWQCPESSGARKIHLAIAYIEFIPVLGALAALIERVVFVVAEALSPYIIERCFPKDPAYFIEEECAICYIPLPDDIEVRLKCNHIFHQACLEGWIQTQAKHSRDPTCPLCLEPVVILV